MFSKMIKQMKTAVCLVVFFTFFTGVIYPVLIFGVTFLVCPWKANGSFIDHADRTVGSLLIGQSFTDAGYFWGRLSATPLFPYNPLYSSASNLGPTNPDLLIAAKNRIAELHHFDPKNKNLIPVDLVTASASGLDPDISLSAALYQVPRIAKQRKISEKYLEVLVQHLAVPRHFSLLGESRVNVLELNLALAGLENKNASTKT